MSLLVFCRCARPTNISTNSDCGDIQIIWLCLVRCMVKLNTSIILCCYSFYLGESWISAIEKRDRKKQLQQLKKSNQDLLPLDKPQWDEAFHRVKFTNKQRLELKESKLLKGEILPLKERMKRYYNLCV